MSDLSSGCGGDSDLEYTSGSEMSTSSSSDVLLRMNSNGDRGSQGEESDRDSMEDFEDSLSDDGSKKSGTEESSQEASENKKSDDFYFEGVEKLLEIWFTRLDGNAGGDNCSLRKIPRYQLEEMLKLVHCEIIDSVSNDEIDSYVLSESSLFVSQRRLILKTCGTTTPLQCLKFLWTLVKDYTGFDCIEDVYYSHKNYKRPQVQKLPYRKFDNEVKTLDDFFQGNPAGGSAYCLGSMNRDCWYLYTYHAPMSCKNPGIMHQRMGSTPTVAAAQAQPHRQLGYPNHHFSRKHLRGETGRVAKNSGQTVAKNLNNQQLMMHAMQMMMFDEPDQTLEVLMSDLDENVMKIFTQQECRTAEEATLKSGINRIIPGMIINDHLFNPCGYSMNGIIKDQGTYMTIHITPESEFSYVSFETNIGMSSYKDIIGRVLDIFRPGKFVLTFFANKASKGYIAHQEMNKMEVVNDHWLRMDNQFCRLEKNDLTYAMYSKFPS